MRVRSRLRNLCIRALTHSMDVKTMVELAGRILGDYDLHRRCGFPESMVIPDHDAARQIVNDLIEASMLLRFIGLLVEVDQRGFIGRPMRIHRMEDIFAEIREMGLTYDIENRMFLENAVKQQTPNWGVISDGDVHYFALLRFDVVGNSRLVREYDEHTITKAYGDLRRMIQEIVLKRNGRLWSWEGDGGLAAFYSDDVNAAAVYAGMEIIHELFLYNCLNCPLAEPIRVRLAVHSGSSEYHSNIDDIKSVTMTRVYQIESTLTLPNTLTVSDAVFYNLDPQVGAWFVGVGGDGESACYRYSLNLEK